MGDKSVSDDENEFVELRVGISSFYAIQSSVKMLLEGNLAHIKCPVRL